MNIPEKVNEAMREGKRAHEKLWALQQNHGEKVWTKEQLAQLSAMFDVISATRNALVRLLDANQ